MHSGFKYYNNNNNVFHNSLNNSNINKILLCLYTNLETKSSFMEAWKLLPVATVRGQHASISGASCLTCSVSKAIIEIHLICMICIIFEINK